MPAPALARLRTHVLRAAILATSVLALGSAAWAQMCTVDVEPNNEPADGQLLGADTCFVGEVDVASRAGQDGYWWDVDEAAAEFAWRLAFEGTSGVLTRVAILHIRYAPNGSDVAGADFLLDVSSQDGAPVESEPFVVAPGRYFVAVSMSEPGAYAGRLRADVRLASGRGRDSSFRDREGAFATVVPLDGEATFAWSLDEEAAGYRWTLRAQGPIDGPLTLELYDAAGNRRLSSATSDTYRRAALPNLGLPAGSYQVRLALDAAGPVTIDAVATGKLTEGAEREPNDRWADADVVTFATPMRATGGNADYFVFDVGPEQAGRPWDLVVEASAQVDVQLYDGERREVQRRRGDGGALRGLVFAEGSYGLYVDQDGDGPYSLAFVAGAPLQDGFEREPNDALVAASAMGDDLTVRGSLQPQDEDVFRFIVDGAPQLWRVQALGEGIEELAVYGPSGELLQQLRADGGRVRIDQLVLLPGEHFVRVEGDAGDYALRLLAQGPAPEPPTPDPVAAAQPAAPLAAAAAAPPPDAPTAAGPPPPPGAVETEPNGELSRSELLEFGLVRVGTLSAADDVDVYRFHLPEDRPVRIELVSPEDGAAFFDVVEASVRAEPEAPGGLAWMERTLLAGPYELRVRTSAGPMGWYQLRMLPVDPLARGADREPNDDRATANALPRDLRLVGHVGETRDFDYYRLPTFAATTAVELQATLADGAFVELIGDGAPRLAFDDAGRASFELAAGAVLDLRVRGRGDYAVTVAFATPPDPTQLAPTVGDAAAAVAFDADVAVVQAFSRDGQRVEQIVTVANATDRARTFTVEAFIDHPASAIEAPATLTVPAGGRVALPVTARLATDLRDDQPLHLTIGLRDDLGIATDTLVLTPVCEAPVAAAEGFWPLPEALLGRLDVAWSGVGGAALRDSSRARAAVDGRATPAIGAVARPDEPLDVDLAGDDPVTLVGTVLHPLGDAPVNRQLRRFEVWTSLDGTTYTQVLAGTLRAARVAQAFVFDAPVSARYARLVVVDNQEGGPEARFGDWQLIAADAAGLDPFDLADPAAGGHVVWSEPLLPQGAILDPENTRARIDGRVPEVRWVVGFHQGRAAQVTHAVVLPPGQGEAKDRFREVTLWASLDGPVGPWTELGTWPLAADAPTTLTLDAPTWVRYLRFDARGHDTESRALDLPTQVQVFERAIDRDYRSILGAWGYDTADASYEFVVGRPATPMPDDVGDDDTAERARRVASGAAASGTVAVAEDEDWLRLTVPAGENRLEVRLSGDPTIAYELLDAAGEAVVHDLAIDGDVRVLTAFVAPGDYLLHLWEPRRSVVFAWDTSGSVSPYTATTYAALAGFARDLDPAREFVQLLAYDDPRPLWLLPYWSADPERAMRAISTYDRSADSSNSYLALFEATEALAEREGTRAVMLITDAETPGYDLTPQLWAALTEARPRVFTFEVSSAGSAEAQDLMQDWAAVNDGVYDLATGVGDLDAGFARAACLLRRPKAYRVEVATAYEAPPGPGTLTVVTGAGGPRTAVEVIFDASGSMGQRLPSGASRIEVAKQVVAEFVQNGLADDTPFALRAFGHITPNSCETRLDVPLGPLDRDAALRAVRAIEPKLFSQTPIAASLEAVAEDVAGTQAVTVLLLTDGVESCDGDPRAAVEALRAGGLTVQVVVVSLGLDDPDDVAAFEAFAAAVGARYLATNDVEGLRAAIATALAVPFDVLGPDGAVVASGLVDGDPVTLPAGTYRVRVAGQLLEARVPGDGSVEVALGR